MNPDELPDQQMLDHFRFVHNVSGGLATTIENMAHGVMLRVRDVHMDMHADNLNHTHEWPSIGAHMAKGWQGAYFRAEAEGLDKRTNQWFYACPKPDCFYTVSADSQDMALERGANHICPHRGPTHIGATVTLEILEEAWIQGDRQYDKLIDGHLEGDKLQQQRGVLKGICVGLALWSRPHFSYVDSVADELRKRRTQREAGNDSYESPGLGSRKYEPIPTEEQKAEAASPRARADKVLTAEEQASMKFAYENKFEVEVLARTYSVSLAVVREVCGLT